MHKYAVSDLFVEKQEMRTTGSQVFADELVVRKELADNFCYYVDAHDSIDGFPDWAKQSLEEHRYAFPTAACGLVLQLNFCTTSEFNADKIRGLMPIQLNNLSMLKPVMICGTRLKWKWFALAKCILSLGNIGQR